MTGRLVTFWFGWGIAVTGAAMGITALLPQPIAVATALLGVAIMAGTVLGGR